MCIRDRGKSANWIAEQAGLKVPAKTKILIAPLDKPDNNHPLAKEKDVYKRQHLRPSGFPVETTERRHDGKGPCTARGAARKPVDVSKRQLLMR